MSSGAASKVAGVTDGAAGRWRPTVGDSHVEVDASGQCTHPHSSHQQAQVEDVPPQRSLTAFQSQVEQRREDEGQDGGGQAADEGKAQLKARDAHSDAPGDQH